MQFSLENGKEDQARTWVDKRCKKGRFLAWWKPKQSMGESEKIDLVWEDGKVLRDFTYFIVT